MTRDKRTRNLQKMTTAAVYNKGKPDRSSSVLTSEEETVIFCLYERQKALMLRMIKSVISLAFIEEQDDPRWRTVMCESDFSRVGSRSH